MIAAYDDRVVMEEMIEAALAALFKEGVPPAVRFRTLRNLFLQALLAFEPARPSAAMTVPWPG